LGQQGACLFQCCVEGVENLAYTRIGERKVLDVLGAQGLEAIDDDVEAQLDFVG